MVVTFDFDDTLLWKKVIRDEDGEIDEVIADGPNPEGLALLKRAISDGHEVHIVTTRYEEMRNDTIDWLGKWKVLGRIKKIHFTNGQLKRDTLARIGSRLHHDDDEEELENLPSGCRGVQLFPHPSWGEGEGVVEGARKSVGVMISEMELRWIIREELLRETYQGFLDRTANIVYRAGLTDDFDVPKEEKSKARQIKQIWSEEADHGFMNKLIKVHWINDRNNRSFDEIVSAMNRLLSMPGSNEISTSAYLPGTRIKSDWGRYGVIVQGKTTLAVNNMDWLYTGHHGKAPAGALEKYKSSGSRKYADNFNSKMANEYVLDEKSYDPESSHVNEFIVGNWVPKAIIQTAYPTVDIPDSLQIRVKNLARIEAELVETGEIPREKFNLMLTYKKITLDMVREMNRKELETFYSLNCKEHIRPEPDSMSSINTYNNLKRVLVGSPELEQFGLPIVDADLRIVSEHK